MAKIFLSFFNGIDNKEDLTAIPCFYESFISGLSEAGNEVFVYSHKNFCSEYDAIPLLLLRDIQDVDPDLIILFNNNFYDISRYFDCPIVIYEVDSCLFYSNKDAIRKNKDRYRFFVPQTESINLLHDSFGIDRKNINYVPFFTSIQAEDILQTTNISFIGTRFAEINGISACGAFMQSSPTTHEIEQFKSCMDEIQNNPYICKDVLIKKLNISSEKVIQNINVADLVGILSGSRRVQVLSQIADLGLDLYGNKSWTGVSVYEPELTLSFKDKSVYSLKHNQDIYNSSKLCININHIQAVSGFSWRVCDIMASNSCLVSEYKSDFSKLFPNINLPTFTNRYEAREQCIKLLKNENMRKDIVGACQESIDKEFRFKHFLKNIESCLGMLLHSNTGVEGSVAWFSELMYLNCNAESVENKKYVAARNVAHLSRAKEMLYYFLMFIDRITFANVLMLKEIRKKLVDKIKRYFQINS